MKRVYWCEFPEKCNWKKISDWLKHEKIIVYLACTSRANYDLWKKKIKKINENIEVNAWPTLPKSEGYWFSGFCTKEAIDQLNQYRGLKIKIDIEPPIPKKYHFLTGMTWLGKHITQEPENTEYLRRKIKSLMRDTDIILSTFPLQNNILKQWGWLKENNLKYSYMFYSTFIPFGFKKLYKHYFKRHFLPYHKEAYIAVGLIGKGIFGNEPIYRSPKQMKKDIQFLRKEGVETLVFFSLEAISQRGEEWLYTSLEIA
ncbi:MAG: hypothetical protein Q8R18_01295 [bacterium]|nr:hypothetical protein [bacterium]